MTTVEGNALVGFLQALAVALDSLLNQAGPQDRTMNNFRRVMDGYLEVAANHPDTDSSDAAEKMRTLKRALYRELDRMPLHRLGKDASLQ